MRTCFLGIIFVATGSLGVALSFEAFAQIQPLVIDGTSIHETTETFPPNREWTPLGTGQSINNRTIGASEEQFLMTINHTQNTKALFLPPERLPLYSNELIQSTSNRQINTTAAIDNIQAAIGLVEKSGPNQLGLEINQNDPNSKSLSAITVGQLVLWNNRESLFQQGSHGACTLNRQGPSIRSCP